MAKTLIKIWCDGGCSLSNKVGGLGCVIELPSGERQRFSEAFDDVTNNQMELMGPLLAAQYLKEHYPAEVKASCLLFILDSEYVIKGYTEWLKKWKRNGWKSSTGPVKNKELWEALDKELEGLDVEFKWVRGHVGHPENEECDRLAVGSYKQRLKERTNGTEVCDS